MLGEHLQVIQPTLLVIRNTKDTTIGNENKPTVPKQVKMSFQIKVSVTSVKLEGEKPDK